MTPHALPTVFVIGTMPMACIEVNHSRNDALMSTNGVVPGWSLALIGNASGQTVGWSRDLDPRRFP